MLFSPNPGTPLEPEPFAHLSMPFYATALVKKETILHLSKLDEFFEAHGHGAKRECNVKRCSVCADLQNITETIGLTSRVRLLPVS